MVFVAVYNCNILLKIYVQLAPHSAYASKGYGIYFSIDC